MIDSFKHIHFLGIKGAGNAGLALLLKAKGHVVCGSDGLDVYFTDHLLSEANIPIELFSRNNITSALDCVVYSTAYGQEHEELIRARELGLRIMSYPEALSELFNGKHGIAVCGSHGKTTTSAMLAYVMKNMGADPSALVGSEILQFGSNMCSGESDYFILEADEYQNKFSYYQPKTLVLTSIDFDHPDFFPNKASYFKVFTDFADRMNNRSIVACWDDEGVRATLASIPAQNIITYGWDPSFEYSASNYHIENGRRAFTLLKNGSTVGDYSLSLIGKHNVSNALAVLATCDLLSLGPLDRLAKILEQFTGTARRFELKGTCGHITVFDDYAHHPTEIRATLHAIRHQFPGKKIWCVFGPHTYSRTKAFLPQFADSFHHVDKVLVLDIFTSARESDETIHSKELVAGIQAASGNGMYAGTHDEALALILKSANDIDILVTMGAGDVYKLAEELVSQEIKQH